MRDPSISDTAFRPFAEDDTATTGNVTGALQDAGYQLPPEMQQVARNLYRLFIENRGETTALHTYLKSRGLTVNDLPDVLRSLFDPPRPLSELQMQKPARGFLSDGPLRYYLGPAMPGYEWHHIIEQNGQTLPELTSDEGIRTWVQNTDNMVQAPVLKHFCVSGYMSSSVSPGVRLRDVIKEHDPVDQTVSGLLLLKLCRVIP